MRKLLVVTGGTKGIGLAIARRFAAEGCDVFTCSRNASDAETFRDDIMSVSTDATAYHVACDLSGARGAESFTGAVRQLNRSIDVLVNNAGYFLPGEITTEPDGTLEQMIGANLYSAYFTTRGLAERMKESRLGHIFNMCSIASIKAYPNGGSYAISKFALLGFSKCLREELKPFNIRVTAVLPGATRTRSWEGSDLPEDRFIPASDIAETIFTTWSLSSRTVVEEILLRPQLGDI